MDVAPDDGGLPDPQVSDNQHFVQVLLPERLHAVREGRMIGHFQAVGVHSFLEVFSFFLLFTLFDRVTVSRLMRSRVSPSG